MTAALVLAAALWTFLAGGLLWVHLRLPRLCDPPPPPAAWPRLTVIAPARDEVRGVEKAARSLLAQDYPDLEVVLVDDRSADGTGEILDRLAAEDARLRVVHVTHLPAGWLGKNHACHTGAAAARPGEWLLFTDADVVFAPDALRRAVAIAQSRQFGHLTVFPEFEAPGFWERAFVAAAGLFIHLKFRVWELPHPRTPAYAGIGAFNLVRRADYDRVGGHAALPLEVIDDVKLGLVLRRSGVRQGAADGRGALRVRWNHGFRATVGGLLKNGFAGVEYMWSVVLVGSVLMALAIWMPLVALTRTEGALALFAAWSVVLPAVLHATIVRTHARGSGWEGLLYPVVDTVVLGVLLASATLATVRGSISWRGTSYALSDLRRGCVREWAWPIRRAVGWR